MNKFAGVTILITGLLFYAALLCLSVLFFRSTVIGVIELWPLWKFYGGFSLAGGLVFLYLNNRAREVLNGGMVLLINLQVFGVFTHRDKKALPDTINWLNSIGFKTKKMLCGIWMMWRSREWYRDRWLHLLRKSPRRKRGSIPIPKNLSNPPHNR